jgi:hypothetical protein
MSDLPDPIHSGDLIWPMVIEKIMGRVKAGVETYGKPLTVHTKRGIEGLDDAIEEAIDMLFYLIQFRAIVNEWLENGNLKLPEDKEDWKKFYPPENPSLTALGDRIARLDDAYILQLPPRFDDQMFLDQIADKFGPREMNALVGFKEVGEVYIGVPYTVEVPGYLSVPPEKYEIDFINQTITQVS